MGRAIQRLVMTTYIAMIVAATWRSVRACRPFDIRKIVEPRNICTGPPEIEPSSMHNLSLVPGQQAVFTCMIEHRCMVPIIKWYYNSPDNSTIKVIKTGKSPGDPHVHKIERVSAEDEGTYSCVAENVIGETRISAYLAVSGAPRIGTTATATAYVISLLLLGQLFPSPSV